MKIQKWLLPSKANKYHPHLLRPAGLAFVVVSLLGLNLAQNVTAAHKFQVLGVSTSISSSEVISLTNIQRANNGLPALNTNSKLMSAAQAKAQDMFAKDYWAHNAPDGTTPWYWITAAGYNYSTAGENLAKGFSTSNGVVQGWMNSPGHRANILNTSFIDTGVAVMSGTLQGESTTLVVAMYGSLPGESPNPPPSSSTPSSTTNTSGTTSTPKKTTPTATAPTTPDSETPAPTAAETPDTKPVEPTVKQTSTPPVASTTAEDAARSKSIDERSVAARESRTWSQNASLFLLSTLLLVTVLKHTIVWRMEKRGWRHIWLRAHPVAQYALIFVAVAANISSGVGVIR
jgi:hypothetical protein